jgi:hypothetical protein
MSSPTHSTHLNDQELLDRLYGLAEPGDHLTSCSDCSTRWEEMRARKTQLSAAPEVSTDFLAAQRRAIYTRLGERPRSNYRWASAVAAAGLIVGVFFVNRPVIAPPPAVAVHATPSAASDASDAQLFAEVYSMRDSTESRAAAPIRALFEERE